MQIISTPPKCNDINKRSVGAAVRGSLLVSTLKSAVAHKQQKKEALGVKQAAIWGSENWSQCGSTMQFLYRPLEAPKSANIKSIQLN